MKRVAVGSTNPIKVAAVKSVVSKIWPEAEVVCLEVCSGVSEMPTSTEEAITGAKNRAARSRQMAGADIGIGLEGGTIDTPHGMFLANWAASYDGNGGFGVGHGGYIPLPEVVAKKIRKGGELGPVMDELRGEKNTKQKDGAVGFLTNGMVPRQAAFERGIVFALARYLNTDMYNRK